MILVFVPSFFYPTNLFFNNFLARLPNQIFPRPGGKSWVRSRLTRHQGFSSGVALPVPPVSMQLDLRSFLGEKNGKWKNRIKKYPLLDSKEAGIMNIWRSQNLVFSRYQQNWQVELTRWLTLDKPAWRYICSLACKPRIGLSSAKYLG